MGRKVLTKEIIQINEGLNIQDLIAGVYMLTGTNENGDLIDLQFVKSEQ